MAMQYDVKSSTKTADGAVAAYRTRLKGIFYTVSTAGGGAPIIYDNASAASGTAVLTLPEDVAGQFNLVIPGEGILCENGIFVDINGADSVVVFYG